MVGKRVLAFLLDYLFVGMFVGLCGLIQVEIFSQTKNFIPFYLAAILFLMKDSPAAARVLSRVRRD
jgi:hypothetical protein